MFLLFFDSSVTELLSSDLCCSGGSLDLVKTNADIQEFRRATGASSVMLARAAMWNASVFGGQGLLPVERVMEEYLKYVSIAIVTGPVPARSHEKHSNILNGVPDKLFID